MSNWISSVATVSAVPASQPRASAAAAEPHPCHNGNNSNESNRPPKPGWKTGALARIGVRNFIERFGFDNCGFYCFTFKEAVEPKEASKRWNSLLTGVIRPRYGKAFIKFTEPQRRGVPHYHVLLNVPGIRYVARAFAQFQSFRTCHASFGNLSTSQ